MFKKRLLITLLMLAFLLPMVKVEAATVKLNKTSLYLSQGTTYTLKIEGSTKAVKWKSLDKSIATVSDKGKIKAVKVGKTTITATIGKNTYKCSLNVVKKLSKADFNKTGYKLDKVGENLTAYFKDGWEDGAYAYLKLAKADKAGANARKIKIGATANDVIKAYGYSKLVTLKEYDILYDGMGYYRDGEYHYEVKPQTYMLEYKIKDKGIPDSRIRFYFNKDKELQFIYYLIGGVDANATEDDVKNIFYALPASN
jgi:hypothetical protein